MTTKSATTSIQIDTRIRAALMLFEAEMTMKKQRSVTTNECIETLIAKSRPDLLEKVDSVEQDIA